MAGARGGRCGVRGVAAPQGGALTGVPAIGCVVVPVAVVTDSTAYLPAGVAEEREIRVVPLEVRLGQRVGREGCDIGITELSAAL
ncbi:MAG TPA: DegV family protein, partial [Pseudonocardia sp.]|nr:DegV family protein [Pseudonocardia sp.]